MTPHADAPQLIARVRIGVVPDSDDQFYGFCPDLGCIHVAADTEQEALRLAIDAVSSYLAMSIRHGDPIPIGIIEREPDVAEKPGLRKMAASIAPRTQKAAKSFVENVPITLAAEA